MSVGRREARGLQKPHMRNAAVARLMASKPFLILATFALALLAGCSDAPPSGDLPAGSPALALEGDVTIDYTAASYPAGQVPVVGTNPTLCPPPQAAGAPQCVPPASSFKVHFMALPTPDASGYHVFLTGPAARDLGALVADEANMWEMSVNFTEDLSANVTGVELRMGSLVLATATGGEGTNAFAVAEDLSAPSVQGTYRGKTLNVTVSNLPANGTYMGRLYTLDEESGLLTPGDFFPLANGSPSEYEAELDIEDYAEFHVHVGSSSVNLYKATFPV